MEDTLTASVFVLTNTLGLTVSSLLLVLLDLMDLLAKMVVTQSASPLTADANASTDGAETTVTKDSPAKSDPTMKDASMVVFPLVFSEVVHVFAHLGIPDFTARLDLNVLLLISLAEMAVELQAIVETALVCVLRTTLVSTAISSQFAPLAPETKDVLTRVSQPVSMETADVSAMDNTLESTVEFYQLVFMDPIISFVKMVEP